MTRSSLVLPATIAALAFGFVAAAQAPSAAPLPPSPSTAVPEPAAPLYQVEVLIFANRDFDPAEEHFEHEMTVRLPQNLDLRPVPVFDEAAFALPDDGAISTPPADVPVIAPAPGLEPGPGLAPAPAAVAEEPFHERALRPDELQLGSPARALGRLSAYRVLAHGGWVQQGLPEDQTLPFDLARLGIVNPSGAIKVYLSRFLHVALDVTYRDPQLAPAAGGAGDELAEIRLGPRYRLHAERQVRSGELHFFDHPAFGVLLKVTPVPAETSDGATRPAA
jgi:hypothetical protein